jgi:hypothetical protein
MHIIGSLRLSSPLDWSARRLIAVRALLTLWLTLMVPVAFAGTNAWNERDLSWGPPATCIDGDPDLTHCPVTGYKVEVAGSCAATTWNALVTIGNTTSYHVTNLKTGSYCFRTRAITAGGEGEPSPVIPESKTIVTPPVPIKAAAPGATRVTP